MRAASNSARRLPVRSHGSLVASLLVCPCCAVVPIFWLLLVLQSNWSADFEVRFNQVYRSGKHFRRHAIALIVLIAVLIAIAQLKKLVDVAVVSGELDIDLNAAG